MTIKPYYNEEAILNKYEEFHKLLGTYSSFNRFYGSARLCQNGLEIIEDLDFYDENEIMIKVLYGNMFIFEVGLVPNPNSEWDYIDSMWIWCDDGSTFGEYYEINLHDLILYKEVKFTEHDKVEFPK